MAIDEYRCRKCGEEFNHRQSFSAQHGSPPSCPSCASSEVQQLFRSVNVHTSKKS